MKMKHQVTADEIACHSEMISSSPLGCSTLDSSRTLQGEISDVESAKIKSCGANGTVEPIKEGGVGYVHGGAPRTSRFMKSLDSSGPAVNAHHCNPYLYTQHKTRPNAPFDMLHVRTKNLVRSCREVEKGSVSGFEYSVQDGSIPVFRVAKQQLPDPHVFYEAVRSIGEKYGAVKLHIHEEHDDAMRLGSHVLSQSSVLNDFTLNTEYFWFKARRQYMNSPSNENSKRLEFHRRLYRFYREGAKAAEGSTKGKRLIGKIPSIDKRTLDLYRLWNCVQLRGGFKTVCQKKLWAQLGRELGYSGRIMSSLSTSLRSAYSKVFSDFDAWELEQRKNTDESSSQPSDFSHIKQETRVDSDIGGKRPLDREGHTEDSQKRKKQHTVFQKVFELGGSSAEFTRVRDVKRCKGLNTNFENVTEAIPGLTEPDQSTLPGYNFSFWQSGMEIYDKSCYETKNSPIYNLRQYYEKSCRHFDLIQTQYSDIIPQVTSWTDKIELQQFEDLYFSILADPTNSLDIDSGIDLPGIIHGSGFRTISRNSDNTAELLDPWNINNVPLAANSLLSYLDIDYGCLTRPKMHVGMTFSTRGWSLGDQYLPTIEYNHLGCSLLWYFIAPESQEAFEKLVEEINLGKRDHPTDELDVDPEFKKSEFYNSYLETNMRNRLNDTHKLRSKNGSHMFGQAARGPKSYLLPNDIQIHPEELQKRGIKFYNAIQEAKTFIIKYPRAYNTSIAAGFHVSESCYLAPESWLSHLVPSDKWFSDRAMLQSINVFQFLHNIMTRCKSPDVVLYAKRLLAEYSIEELENRKKLVKHFPDMKIVANTFDFISDEDLGFTGASKVLLTTSSDCITLSIKSFLTQLHDETASLRDVIRGISKDEVHLSMHTFFSDKLLECLINDVDDPASPIEKLADVEAELTALITRYPGRVPLSKLLPFIHVHHASNNPRISEVRQYLRELEPIITDCRLFLDTLHPASEKIVYGSGFNIRELPTLNFQNSAKDLQRLCAQLRPLSVEFEEMTHVFALMHQFQCFHRQASVALHADDLEAMKSAYEFGISIGISTPLIPSLAAQILRTHWLHVFDLAIVRRSPSCYQDYQNYNLSDMYRFLRLGIRYLNANLHKDKLQKISSLLKSSQALIQRANAFFKKKNYRVSLNDVELIMEKLSCDFIPLNPTFVDGLTKLMAAVKSTKQSIAPSWSRLAVRGDHVTQFVRHFRDGDDAALSQICQFDGSEEDKRISMEEIAQEKEPQLFGRYVKECRAWLQDLNKLVPNARATLEGLLEQDLRCFELAKDEYLPLEHSQRQSVYCFCRQGDVGSTMVECEICREWYHVACINRGRWALPEDDRCVFLCMICHPEPAERPRKVPLQDLLELLCRSASLHVIPDRVLLQRLFELAGCALSFRRHLRRELFDNSNVRWGVSVHKLKFYLRKLEGARCELTSELATLRDVVKEHDLQKLHKLRNANCVPVTGYEKLTARKQRTPLPQLPAEPAAPSVDIKPDPDTAAKCAVSSAPRRIGIADLLSPLPEDTC
ncbi:AFL127Cp [Eremothecium gossypii ATCC 10895]|uniref:AFL127Cp n=1 Tax=Eremothecium gossypii (strain ATCC 10895 / CBS 109.51 / FGSC 9923 / NRRL Y-1056) TaxID=284811 RepID=Q755F0_EREGS|nr:AFL127Cp [Eremothecium gossypii ATCC 10895]AAS53247.1 AFL127Cp [Eremothecium gossypii ATCC 10895]